MLRLCVMTRLLHIARTVIYDPRPSLLLHPQEFPQPPIEYNNTKVKVALLWAERMVWKVALNIIDQSDFDRYGRITTANYSDFIKELPEDASPDDFDIPWEQTDA